MTVATISRRSFLKIASLAGGGMVLKGFWVPSASGIEAVIDAEKSPWFFAQFNPDGTLLLKLAKQEMGQGAPTGVAMLLTEELGADWSKVRVTQMEFSEASKLYYDSPRGGGTGGSSSVNTQWEPMRKAGAAAREMLIQAAAQQWKVPPSACEAKNGRIAHAGTGRSAGFHELAATAVTLPIPEDPPLKDPASFTIIGKSKPNAYNRELSAGAAPYGINVKLPGMLYAAVQRCSVHGGKLVSFDASAALKISGVVDVLELQGREPDDVLFRDYKPGVAVVADSTWAAFRGKEALVTEWDEGPNGTANVDTLRLRCQERQFIKTETKNDVGNPESVLSQSERIHEAIYETHFQPHVCMEPLNATARVEGDRVEVWTSTQSAHELADAIAVVMEIPVANVKVHSLVAGGSFGRRIWIDFTIEAVLIATALKRPIKVTWTREDEIRHDYFHPYERSHWKACLDEENLIAAATKDFGVVGSPNFWWILHWAYLPYGIKNVKVTANLLEEPLATGAWRSVTEHLGAFSEECFIDEMAQLANEDPYAFRLRHARRAVATFEGDDYWRQMTQRALDVLEAIPQYVDWSRPLPRNHGRGMAMSKFGSTVVAQVAEVVVEDEDFRVIRVDAIVDAGVVINPQLAENQIEGAIVWGLSALKYGRLAFENGRIQESNFHDFSILRISETPEMSVHFLSSDGPLGGMGEPGVPAVAPAVLNAIFAACGKRLRTLPVDRTLLMA